MAAHSHYRPASLSVLGEWLSGNSEEHWQSVREFLTEYWNEPVPARPALLLAEPAPTGSAHWDVFLAALAEHLAAKTGSAAPRWAQRRDLAGSRW